MFGGKRYDKKFFSSYRGYDKSGHLSVDSRHRINHHSPWFVHRLFSGDPHRSILMDISF